MTQRIKMDAAELATQVVNSKSIVGTDDLTNAEKFMFICHVFDVESIVLNQTFDYEVAIETGDPLTIRAALYLASLQTEYLTRLHLEKLVGDDEHDENMEYLILSRSKLRWANSFAQLDEKPPHYPFVN